MPGARVHVSWPAGARRLSPLCASLSEQLWLHLSLCVTPTPTHPGGGGGSWESPKEQVRPDASSQSCPAGFSGLVAAAAGVTAAAQQPEDETGWVGPQDSPAPGWSP